MGNRSYPGAVLGDVVGAAVWGSKIYRLRGGWMMRTKVYDACSGGVVCLSLDIGKVWRIVPCVYKIYTLGRFQFHNLLRRNLVIRAAGGLWI